MKKTLVRTPKPRLSAKSLTLRARLGGGLALLGLIAALGLAAERPARTAGGPIAVDVANAPLPTAPTDLAAPQQPFSAQTIYVIQNGSENGFLDAAGGNKDIAVPAGKRLVIQTVSMYHGEENKGTIQAYINPVVNGNADSSYALPSVPSNGTAYPGTTQSMDINADAGSKVGFAVYRNQSAGADYIYLTVSGYLVNA